MNISTYLERKTFYWLKKHLLEIIMVRFWSFYCHMRILSHYYYLVPNWENADVNNLFQMVSPTWGVRTTSTDRHQNLPPGKMCRKAEGFYLHFTQGDGKSPKLNKEDNFIRSYVWWRPWLEMSLFPSNPTHSHPCDTINPHSWCVKTDSGGRMLSLKWG